MVVGIISPIQNAAIHLLSVRNWELGVGNWELGIGHRNQNWRNRDLGLGISMNFLAKGKLKITHFIFFTLHFNFITNAQCPVPWRRY